MLVVMLDRLETHDGIEAAIFEGKLGRGRFDETQSGAPVLGGGMSHRLIGNVHAHDVDAGRCEKITAIALAAGHVEDTSALPQFTGQQIAVHVFEFDLSTRSGQVTLTGHFQ